MKLLAASVLCSMTLLVAGCSSGSSTPSGIVTGKVTFKGAPVAEGTVRFISSGDTPPCEANIESDGSYRATTAAGGLPTGDYRIAVTPPLVVIPATASSPGSEELKPMENIPLKYRNADNSGLAITIREGAQTFDISMTE